MRRIDPGSTAAQRRQAADPAASAVSADHVQNFDARKAKKSAAAKGGVEAPKPEEKKWKAPKARADFRGSRLQREEATLEAEKNQWGE